MLVGLDVRCKKSRLLPRHLSGALGTEWALPKMEKGIGFGEEDQELESGLVNNSEMR